MKLSYAISFHKSSFNFIAEGDLKILSNLGYDGVEISVRKPNRIRVGKLEKLLRRYRLGLSAIGTGQMFLNDGLSLSSPKKSVRVETINRIKKCIEMAALLNSQVIIGLVRGKMTSEESAKLYMKNLKNSFRYISDWSNHNKVILTIEPINRYETSFLNNIEETLGFVKDFKNPFVRVLIDTFHMNIEEKDFKDSIQRAADYISHVHLADNNRKIPGDGHLNFREIVDALKKINYTNYLSAEILPMPNFKECAKLFIQRVKGYLK